MWMDDWVDEWMCGWMNSGYGGIDNECGGIDGRMDVDE